VQILVLINVSNAYITHDWGKLKSMMFTDFRSPHMLTDDQVNFLVNNFAVVSLEKCTGQLDGFQTIDAQYIIAKKIKAASPNTKVLIYWSADLAGYACENLTHFVDQHPEWQLKDLDNNLVSVNQVPQVDFRIPSASDWWTNVILEYASDITNVFDGVLVDGPGWKTYPRLDDQVRHDLSIESFRSLKKLQDKWNQKNRGTIIGNGISMYGPKGDEAPSVPYFNMNITQYAQGIMSEHFAAFESYDANGNLDISRVLKNMQLIIDASNSGSLVVVATWPGKTIRPYGVYLNQPQTPEDWRKLMLDSFNFKLGLFLMVANTNGLVSC
jgi:hypothetical protein